MQSQPAHLARTRFRRDADQTVSPDWSMSLDNVQPAEHHSCRDADLAEHFARDGFVVIDDVFTADEMAQIRSRIEHYRTLMAPRLPGTDWVRYEPDGAISNMYSMHRFDPFFHELGCRADLTDLVCRTLDGPMEFKDLESFDKPAFSGPAAVPHQDGIYMEGTDFRLAHVWMPIDAATAGNGAMLYWPGSHRGGLLDHYRIDADMHLGGIPDAAVADLGPPRIAEVRSGQAIIHGDRVVHASNANRSASPRCAVAICYVPPGLA